MPENGTTQELENEGVGMHLTFQTTLISTQLQPGDTGVAILHPFQRVQVAV
jgi:hypothetical protein